jgi:hypothetical protein
MYDCEMMNLMRPKRPHRGLSHGGARDSALVQRLLSYSSTVILTLSFCSIPHMALDLPVVRSSGDT